MTDEQRIHFHNNFQMMLLKIGTSPYYINGEGRTDDNSVLGRSLAPSYTTLCKCENDISYEPTARTLNRLIDFYNANLEPSTDAYTFISMDINASEVGKIQNNMLYRQYLGIYYVYYYSDNFIDEIHGGLLQVYELDGRFRAHLIMSLKESYQFKDVLDQVFHRSNTRTQIRKSFDKYRQRLPDAYRHCYYCEGPFEMYDRCVIMNLTNPNVPAHKMYITINTEHNSVQQEYPGSLAVYLSPSVGNLQTRFCKMAITRKEFPLDHPILGEFLDIDHNLTKFHRFEMTLDEDRSFYNQMLYNRKMFNAK